MSPGSGQTDGETDAGNPLHANDGEADRRDHNGLESLHVVLGLALHNLPWRQALTRMQTHSHLLVCSLDTARAGVFDALARGFVLSNILINSRVSAVLLADEGLRDHAGAGRRRDKSDTRGSDASWKSARGVIPELLHLLGTMLGDTLSPGEDELVLKELLVGGSEGSLGSIVVLAAILEDLVVLGLASSDLLNELQVTTSLLSRQRQVSST